MINFYPKISGENPEYKKIPKVSEIKDILKEKDIIEVSLVPERGPSVSDPRDKIKKFLKSNANTLEEIANYLRRGLEAFVYKTTEFKEEAKFLFKFERGNCVGLATKDYLTQPIPEYISIYSATIRYADLLNILKGK